MGQPTDEAKGTIFLKNYFGLQPDADWSIAVVIPLRVIAFNKMMLA